MVKLLRSMTKKKVVMVGLAFVLTSVLALSGIVVNDRNMQADSEYQIGVGQKVITIGHIAYAAGTADYTCDGNQDYVQFNLAIAALPASGGKISVLSGSYDWTVALTTVNVTANVTIEGVGMGTSFIGDGATALFTAVGNGCVFANFRTDTGGVNLGATTGWQMQNVLLGATYYAYRSTTGQSVFNDATVASLTDSGLTSGRVPIAGVGGLLGDSANLTFTSPSLQVGGANVTRSATYVVAASDAPAHVRAQADYICDGTADEVEIQAALDNGRGTVMLASPGTFVTTASIQMASYRRLLIPAGVTLRGTSNTTSVVTAQSWSGGGWEYLNADSANWVVNVGTVTLSNNTTVFNQGTGSLMATVTALAGGVAQISRTFASQDLTDYGMLSIWERVSTGTFIKFSVQLYDGDGDYIQWDFETTRGDYWAEFFCPFNAYDSSSGVFNFDNVVKVATIFYTASAGNWYYLDELKIMTSNVVIEGGGTITFADTAAPADGCIEFYGAANWRVSGMDLSNNGDECISISSCRQFVVANNIMKMRYTIPALEGNAVVWMSYGPGAGVDANTFRNRFGTITGNHIYGGQPIAILVSGDGHIVTGNDIHGLGGVGAVTGTTRGIALVYTFTYNNLISGNFIELVENCLYTEQGVYNNLFTDNILIPDQSGTGIRLYSDTGAANVFRGNSLYYNNTAHAVVGSKIEGAVATNTVIESNEFTGFKNAITFTGASDGVQIINNRVTGCTTGFTILAGCDNTRIEGNVFTTVTTPIVDSGTGTAIKRNVGYVTENSGLATILNGNISVTVNHSLSTNATSILLTGTHAEVRDCIATSITDTQFTITAAANVTANRDVYWRAVVGAGN